MSSGSSLERIVTRVTRSLIPQGADGLRSGSLKAVLFWTVLAMVALPRLGLFYQQVFVLLLINIIIASSFRFITLMGKWSFAQLPLVGVGAYTTALLTTRLHWSPWLTFPAAILAATLIALAFSYPCLRSTGFYFFMSTYAAGALLVWAWNTFVNPFGGTDGLFGIPPLPVVKVPGLGAVNFGAPLTFGFFVAAVTGVSLLVLARLEQIRFGAIVKGFRSHTPLAISVGGRQRLFETSTFLIGSAFAWRVC